MTAPDSAERWFFCRAGHIHWGALGGAGLLLRHLPSQGQPLYLLTERSRWIDEGGTWGIPGGAIHHGESPEETAHRAAAEQIWPLPAYRVTGIVVQDCCGGWKFHIVGADIDAPFTAYAARDTDATGWFTVPEMDHLRLYSGVRRWADEHPQP
jgi:8-oxo-dGTP pyrophosphatase MutT (NUDIX family)